MRRIPAVTCLALVAGMCSGLLAGSPVGWRTDGAGQYPQATPPTQWGPDKNILWRTPLESWSNSMVALADGKLYCGAEKDALVCLRASDGQVLWTSTTGYDALVGAEAKTATQPTGRKDRAGRPKTHRVTGYSTPTPIADGQHVWSVYGTGIVACHDVKGERKWVRFLERPKHGWGYSSSPVMVDGKLIVHVEKVYGLDPVSGKTLWVAPSRGRFGTPAVMEVAGMKVVVTANGEVIRASDGKVMINPRGALAFNSPIVSGDVAYFIQHNGYAMKIESDGQGGLKHTELWRTHPKKDRYYASSIIHDGLIYAITRNKDFSIIDAASGEVVLAKRLDLGKGTAYPSITLAGGKLFVSSDGGTTLVLQPGREYKEIARNELEGFRSTPVFVGSRFYLRTMKGVVCVGQ